MSGDEDDTVSLDLVYKEKVTINDRLFQKYSIDNDIYCVPIDEVR